MARGARLVHSSTMLMANPSDSTILPETVAPGSKDPARNPVAWALYSRKRWKITVPSSQV